MDLGLNDQKITSQEAVILLSEKDHLIHQQSTIIDKKSGIIAAQKKRITILEDYLRLERARLYGCSSEKNPGQSEIFNEAELLGCTPDDDDEAIEAEQIPSKPKKKVVVKACQKVCPGFRCISTWMTRKKKAQ